MNINKNILITGSNRSGSTWVGKVIATNPKVDNIIEPLNLNRIKRFKRISLDCWYPKITNESSEPLQQNVRNLINFYLNTDYKSVITQMFDKYEGYDIYNSFKKRIRRASKPIKLLKDPTAIFSVPWLVEQFDLNPVILIRHPAAYVLSIKEKNWWFDFDNLLKQQDFFSGELKQLEIEVKDFKLKEKEKSIIENASLMWKVFYSQVIHYRKKYPKWIYITHEELSIDPLDNYKRMFTYLDLEFSNNVISFINDSTNSDITSEYKRNAKKNVQKWKQILDYKELDIIYGITHSISNEFYDKWF